MPQLQSWLQSKWKLDGRIWRPRWQMTILKQKKKNTTTGKKPITRRLHRCGSWHCWRCKFKSSTRDSRCRKGRWTVEESKPVVYFESQPWFWGRREILIGKACRCCQRSSEKRLEAVFAKDADDDGRATNSSYKTTAHQSHTLDPLLYFL